jgi:hypothetical protein
MADLHGRIHRSVVAYDPPGGPLKVFPTFIWHCMAISVSPHMSRRENPHPRPTVEFNIFASTLANTAPHWGCQLWHRLARVHCMGAVNIG